jgi:hypothetical protein
MQINHSVTIDIPIEDKRYSKRLLVELLSNLLDNLRGRSKDCIKFMIWGYNRAQEVFSMVVKNREGIVWKITFIVVLVLGLSLGACGNGDQGEAQAQVFERGVRTYDIVPNTFQLQSNTDPTIVVTGEATQYTLVDDGRVIFTANDPTGARNIVLDPGDIVIERPMANSVTVVTQRNRLS